MGQDIIERKIDQTYENCRGVVRIADDVHVLVNEKAHDINFQDGIECTRKTAIKLNFDKCIIKTKYCRFFFFFDNLYTP